MGIRRAFLRLSAFAIAVTAVALSASLTAKVLATASSYGGSYSDWPSVWTAIGGLNDPDDSLANERIDFVGDANDPAAFYAEDSDYCYFRVRVDDGSTTEFSDSVFILIDQNRDGSLDYAFAWDSQAAIQDSHGLEMMVPNVSAATWEGTRMNDRDGNGGQKFAPPCFGVSNGDGYIRIQNNQATASFGTTTFIDFAVSWSYLSSDGGDGFPVSTLGKGQSWDIQLGSITQSNDHSFIDYDVAGNKTPPESVTFPGAVSFGPTAIMLTKLSATSGLDGWWAPAFIAVFVLTGVAASVAWHSARGHVARSIRRSL